MFIGLFGGAFDPPHSGHQQLLKRALALKFFDEIWIVPTFLPPLKMTGNHNSVAGSEERLEMCKLLTGDKKIKVLDLEIKRGGKSYSIDTVRELKKKYPRNKFYFLIGSDWVPDLSKWHRANELLKEIEFVSLPRTEISSSEIRERIKNGENIGNLVPEEIEKYIKEHELYK